MHELAICQALMKQVLQIAEEKKARRVVSVKLQIGPLSGVEPELLRQAYPIAAAGTLAETSRLEMETCPIRVRCLDCGELGEAAANRLICSHCGSWQTVLQSGDEMILASLELET